MKMLRHPVHSSSQPLTDGRECGRQRKDHRYQRHDFLRVRAIEDVAHHRPANNDSNAGAHALATDVVMVGKIAC
jgi:hypothetical protein